MSDDITQKLRFTMPDFKGIEISCPCRIRSSLMKEAADEIEKLARERDEARAEVDSQRAENELQRAEIELQRTSRHREARAFEAEHNRLQAALNTARRERDEARSKETDYGEGFEEGWIAAQKGAAAEVEDLRDETGRLQSNNDNLTLECNEARAEVERLRAEKEDLYASIAGIERAAAGAIYSQESIHAMALYALKPLMERGIETLEAKP